MVNMYRAKAIVLFLLAACALPARADEPLGIGLEGFPYPHDVRYLPLLMNGEPVRMAYMDVAPTGTANGRTALLLHGRHFFGEYWKDTIAFLAAAGWRVVVPDQIGFGKSSKPDVALSFHGLARNTRALLDSLGVGRADLIAHSMGCMLAVRFALMYPEAADRLVLEGPIGLEDYRLKVPYSTREELIAASRAQTRESIERFFRGYFVHWQERFQVYPDVAWRWTLGPEAERLHRVSAHSYAMAYEQPVVYELARLRARTLIVVGERDRSAIGRNLVTPEIRETLGRLPELAHEACEVIADCTAVTLNETGHIPHLETPDRFHAVLFSFLALPPGGSLDSGFSPARPASTKMNATPR
jgi:pimeloyl-ACP methyl ester carboxylesterase